MIEITHAQAAIWQKAFGMRYPRWEENNSYSKPGFAATSLLVNRSEFAQHFSSIWIMSDIDKRLLMRWQRAEMNVNFKDWQSSLYECGIDHTYWDMSCAYLRAAARVQLPRNHIRETDVSDLEEDDVGLFLVDIPEWKYSGLMPHPISYATITPQNRWGSGKRWICTPTLNLLYSLWDEGCITKPVIWKYYVSEGKPITRDWANRLNSVLTDKEFSPIHDMIKHGYSEAIGQMNKRTTNVRDADGNRQNKIFGVFRPDWRNIIISENYTRIWRICWQTGKEFNVWPLYINCDAIGYLGTEFPNSKFSNLFKVKEIPSAIVSGDAHSNA